MVTRTDDTMSYAAEFAGKSSDTKPTEHIPNGSTFMEMDTSKVFVFDEATMTWLEL